MKFKELLATGKTIRDEQSQLAADTHTKLVLFKTYVYRTMISSSKVKVNYKNLKCFTLFNFSFI